MNASNGRPEPTTTRTSSTRLRIARAREREREADRVGAAVVLALVGFVALVTAFVAVNALVGGP